MNPRSKTQHGEYAKDITPHVKRTPPYECLVGDYTFEMGRIPDEFQIKLMKSSGVRGHAVFELSEWYAESFKEHKSRYAQFESDKATILKDSVSASCSYDQVKGMTIIRIVQEGERPEMIAGIFKEMTVQAKYFLSEDETDFIYENILVEGAEDE